MPRVLVVGGGILGTFHALEAIRRGWDVDHFDADAEPHDASARSPGAITPSFAADGLDLDLSLASRAAWEDTAAAVTGLPFRSSGSLVVATDLADLAVLHAAAEHPSAPDRQWRLLSPAEVRAMSPSLQGDSLLGALHSPLDAVIEPRGILGALRAHLEAQAGYRFLGGREVRDFDRRSITDSTGRIHTGDLVVLCVGARANLTTSLSSVRSGLRRVRLQLLQTEPTDLRIRQLVADVRTLQRHDVLGRHRTDGPAAAAPPRATDPVAEEFDIRFNCVQRDSGALTIGEAREVVEPFEFDLAERPAKQLLGVLEGLTGAPAPAVVRRWSGTIHDCTDDRLWHREDLDDTVAVVTGADQRGITLAPAIAADTFDWLVDGEDSGGSLPSARRTG